MACEGRHRVNAFGVLIATAMIQVVFLAALLVFLVDRRRRTRARSSFIEERRREAQQDLRSWMAGGASIEGFIAALASMPADAALEFASELTASVLDAQSREALSTALQKVAWVQRIVAQASSRAWWRRREAARALTLVGADADSAAVLRLLKDSNTAVAIIAIGAMPRAANDEMIGWALDRYPSAPTVARRLISTAFAQLRARVEPLLIARLTADADPAALFRWIPLAAELQFTHALDRVAALDSHPDVWVRRAVARALAHRPHPDSMAVLRALITDESPEVRASAAWAMGQINSVAVLPHLTRAVHDPAWDVRYQTALALATLGEKGRAVLAELRDDPDRYVADVAVMVSGLGDGALMELVAE